MGEVYAARDTRLERTVALKVLSFAPGQADLTDRLERFHREARAVSRLSHPNICSLFDVGEQDGQAFLVMEHLEGETLAARLAQGPLPLARALRYGVEIASALDAAHRQGIVHRDLKPANIMLTRECVKLLDFGLARLRPDADDALARSGTADLTDTGTVLGTVPYMAPEHLDGKEADARADIFALGVVLYEMVCGRRPFAGDSKARIIAAILEQEPVPASTVQPLSPPVLDHVLKRCLAKDPEERWQAARDVAIALNWVAEGGSAAGLPAPVARRRDWRLRLSTAAAASLAGVALGGVLTWALTRPKPAPLRPSLRLEVNLDPPPLIASGQGSLALSPDASRLAYVTGTRLDHRLALRLLSQPQSVEVPGSEGAANPFFSPDGQWVAFFADGSLKKVAVAGGAPLTLCAAGGQGGSWGPDDTITFSGGPGKGLQRVAASGGRPQELTALDTAKGESEHSYGRFLPGGRALIFTVVTRRGAVFTTTVQDLRTGERRKLFTGSDARYVPSGHLVYRRGRFLYAARFDLRRLALAGPEAAMLDDVWGYALYPVSASDLAASGTFVYAPTNLFVPRHLMSVDRKGQAQPLSVTPAPFETPRLSRDGRTVVVGVNNESWRLDVERGALTRLTFGPGGSHTPALSPDGLRVAYGCRRQRPETGICVRAADASGGETELFRQANAISVGGWTPDGQALVFVVNAMETGHDVWTVKVDGDSRPRSLLASPFNEKAPSVSPDGRWLAYGSDESGQPEVYVQAFPSLGAKLQVSTDGGSEPVWNPSGGELFYRRGDEMMAVSVATGASFRAETPRPLFSGRYMAWPQRANADYTVSTDGQRFLMLKQAEATSGRLVMVVDWVEELKRRLP